MERQKAVLYARFNALEVQRKFPPGKFLNHKRFFWKAKQPANAGKLCFWPEFFAGNFEQRVLCCIKFVGLKIDSRSGVGIVAVIEPIKTGIVAVRLVKLGKLSGGCVFAADFEFYFFARRAFPCEFS